MEERWEFAALLSSPLQAALELFFLFEIYFFQSRTPARWLLGVGKMETEDARGFSLGTYKVLLQTKKKKRADNRKLIVKLQACFPCKDPKLAQQRIRCI